MKVAGVLIGLVVAAVLVVGCGGSDESNESGTTTSITKAEFVRQANAICKKAAADREAAALALFKEQRERGAPSKGELQAQTEEVMVEVVLPALSQMTDELADLGTPKGDGDQVDAIIGAYRTAAEEIESDPAQVVDGEADPFVQPRALAVAYGADDCAGS